MCDFQVHNCYFSWYIQKDIEEGDKSDARFVN